jgi:hypothetical protein
MRRVRVADKSLIGDVYFGGVGLHEARLEMTDPKKLITWAKFLMVISLLYLAGAAPAKLAILTLYLTVFTQKLFHIISYVIVSIIVMNWIITTSVGFAICQPFDYLWTQTPGGYCMGINAWFRWSGLPNIITDVFILILPIPIVLKLHASTQLKSGILITLAVGSL